MTRILRLLLAAIAAVIIVDFAIANRELVNVSLAPLPFTMELPAYGVFLFGLVIGALIGALAVWFGSLAKGREARRMRNKVWALENQLSLIKQEEEKRQAERYSSSRAIAPAAG